MDDRIGAISIGGNRSGTHQLDNTAPHKVTGTPVFPKFVSGVNATEISNSGSGVLDIETVNPTCIVWCAGVKDSAFAIQ